MRILTPSGYRSPATLANGDEVCAFDAATGAAIINTIENIDFVDYAEWCRWWQVEDTVPGFVWYRINGAYLLFGEQSIWRNGTSVCHARHLVVGDEIYDDTDHPILITSIEAAEDNSLVWYRFDISGDHSYIVDGLTLHNASRFWVGGTGTWDSSTTTHWAATTGGAGGQTVPGSADTVTFNASSGAGTATLNFGGTITIQSLSTGTYTGTFENSVNNNNIALASSAGFDNSNTGVRTIKLGSATYTLSSDTASWSFSTTTGLTFIGSSANIVFTGATGGRLFAGGNLSYGSLACGASSGSGIITLSGSNTIGSLLITAPNYIAFTAASTTTITIAIAWVGSVSAQIFINSTSLTSIATIAVAASSVSAWCAFRSITFTGSTPTASNSFDLLNNTGVTITGPSVGGLKYTNDMGGNLG